MKLLLALTFLTFFLIGCNGDGKSKAVDTGTSTPANTSGPSEPTEETTYLISIESPLILEAMQSDQDAYRYIYITNDQGKEYKLTFFEMIDSKLNYCLKIKGTNFSGLSIKILHEEYEKYKDLKLNICDNCPKTNYSIEGAKKSYPVRNITNNWFSSAGNTQEEILYVPFHIPRSPSASYPNCSHDSCYYWYIIGKRGTNLDDRDNTGVCHKQAKHIFIFE